MTIEEALKVIDLNIDKLNGSMQMAVRTLLQDKTLYEEGFKAGLEWKDEQMRKGDPVALVSVDYANRCFEYGKQAMKRQMLILAKNRYEMAMTFVSGKPEVDQAIQQDRLGLVTIIKKMDSK